MKNAKKLLAMLLVVMMTMALALPAFAADDDCTITVKNASKGQTYEAFQVFTAIDNEDGTYSYYANATVKAAIAADEDAPFEVADSASEYGYAIIVKDGADDDAIVDWLDENKAAFGDAIDSVEAEGNTVVLSVKKGFY